MKTINQNKLDKTIQLLLLVVLDLATVYCFIELVLTIRNTNFTLKSLPLFFFFLGLTPFVISQHLKTIPKNIEKKLTYLFVFSACILLVFMLLSDFFTDGFADVKGGIFNLIIGVLFSLLGISMIIKLFSTEKINSSNQQ